jgi:DNA primase
VSGAAVLSRGSVDLLALIGRDTRLTREAGTRGGEYAGPCPSCGGKDRFRVQPETGLWWCRSCRDRWSDAIDYVRWRSGCSFVDACRELGVDLVSRDTRLPAIRTAGSATAAPNDSIRSISPTLAEDAAEPAAVWRERGERVVGQAEADLWSDAGAGARRWLNERGLTDDTIRRWRLGYQARDSYQEPAAWGLIGKLPMTAKRVWLPHGIVIPWYLDGALWQIKVRRPSGEPRYVAVRGGHPVLYGAGTLAGHDLVALPEGELDAILLEQECGDLVGVATLGGASKRLDARAADYLLGARVIFTLHDADAAGDRGAEQFRDLTSRAHRLRVPVGKDIGDFVKAGGDLRAWLAFESERLDLGNNVPNVEAEADTEILISEPAPAREPRGTRVRWGRERGDVAVQDPQTGEWHEMAYREATPVWQAAVRSGR